MSAKEQAIMDIRQDLQSNGKCFIAFRANLNPIMDKLVNEGVLKLKKLEESKKLINKRIEE